MEQKKENNKKTEAGKLGKFKNQIKKALAQPIEEETIQEENLMQQRTVRLVIMNSHCGCGMFNFEIERDVDWNSPLQDGDGIDPDDYLPTDRLL